MPLSNPGIPYKGENKEKMNRFLTGCKFIKEQKGVEVTSDLQAFDLPPWLAMSRLSVYTQGRYMGRKQDLATEGMAKGSKAAGLCPSLGLEPAFLLAFP